jgi:uncharacterized protein YndB with AHSA1/START domain
MDVAVAARSEFTLRLKHSFAASREKVFAAWTTPEALRRWWCPPGWHPHEIQIDLREGGRYRFSMQRESGGQLIAAHGVFLMVNRPSRLVYTWNWDGLFPDMPETQIVIDFNVIDTGTEIVLHQEDLPMRVCAKHLSGWIDTLNRFEKALYS